MTSNTYIYIQSLTISKPFNLIDNILYYLIYTKLSMDPRAILELIIRANTLIRHTPITPIGTIDNTPIWTIRLFGQKFINY